MVLVDTSLWVDLLRGQNRPGPSSRIEALLHAGEAAWCGPVRLELWPCARGAAQLSFLNRLAALVADLEVSMAVWEDAIRLATRARAAGAVFPFPDLLILACARVHEVELLHRDKHFDRLAKLQ